MSKPDIRLLTDELERDLATVTLPSAAAVRRRGEARRARSVVLGAVAVIAVTSAGGASAIQYVGQRPDPVIVGSSVGVRVSVFYDNNATATQRAKVEEELRTFRVIGYVLFETREEAYAQFKGCYPADETEGVKLTDLPQSERLILADPADFDELKRRVEALPGVWQVVNSSAIGFPTPGCSPHK